MPADALSNISCSTSSLRADESVVRLSSICAKVLAYLHLICILNIKIASSILDGSAICLLIVRLPLA